MKTLIMLVCMLIAGICQGEGNKILVPADYFVEFSSYTSNCFNKMGYKICDMAYCSICFKYKKIYMYSSVPINQRYCSLKIDFVSINMCKECYMKY